MNYKNIQNQLFKFAFKSNKKPREFMFDITEDDIIICKDGIQLIIIPKCYFILDINMIFTDNDRLHTEKFFQNKPRYSAEYIGIWEGESGILNHFRIENGDDLYIQRALMQDIDIKNCTFASNGRYAPLYIYEEYKLKMIIMPWKGVI